MGCRDVFRFLLQYILGAIWNESYTFISSLMKSGTHFLFYIHLLDGPIILAAYLINYRFCRRRVPKLAFEAFILNNLLLGSVFVLHLIDLYNQMNHSIKIAIEENNSPNSEKIERPLCMTIFYGIVVAVMISSLGMYFTEINDIVKQGRETSYLPSVQLSEDTLSEEYDDYFRLSMHMSIATRSNLS